MSFLMRLSIIMVLLLASTALGLIAMNANLPKPTARVVQSAPAPAASGYYVAAHELPAGTLARDEDFTVRAAPPEAVPSGAILDTPEAKAGLRGSLVRKFLDAGAPITTQDILRPRDRGFLASVLAPGSRAVSIKVDDESGVSGLIWPGDFVDVVLTQINDKLDRAHRTMSEVVLHGVRVIAIDQDIVQGAQLKDAKAGKVTHSVSLQLAPGQVQKISVAKDLGKLSLAIRAADGGQMSRDLGTLFGCDVSPEIARQNAMAQERASVVVYAGDKSKVFSVRKYDADDSRAPVGCDMTSGLADDGADLASLRGNDANK
jgi:pilus assembly protein CpaB